MRRVGRTTTLITSIAVALAALTGCGSSENAAARDGGDSAASGKFPVTIDSALGKAVIEEQPERVVTLGTGSAGTSIALGVIPVGMEEYPWGSDETGYLPWIHEAVTEAGGTLPEQFTGGTELDVEALVGLDPDVILAPWSGITRNQFDILSDIAPTVAYPELPWTIAWDEQIRTIGKALGKPRKAEAAIDRINARFAEVTEENPQFGENTFVYTYTTGPGTLGVFLPEEQRVAMLTKMGLKLDPVVKTLPEAEGTASSVLGLENADTIGNADLMFTFHMDEKTRRQVESQPLYAQIPAVERGSVVAARDHSFVTASSIINPLTVPWAIDRYVPLINKAIERAR
ncbi:iron-siderophore ABC transporter substrate-binding protein [Halopolyspora algeriensis]